MVFCSLTIQQPQPESWEREEAAARSQQPQSHSTAPHSISHTKTSKADAASKGSTTLNMSSCTHSLEGHLLTPAGIWGHRGTTTPPLFQQTMHKTSSVSQVFTAGKAHLWDLTGKKRHSQEKKKKGFSSTSQKQLDVVIISEICLCSPSG